MLLLLTLAASPDLHEKFHGAGNAGNEDNCAVTLFANGVSLASTATLVPLPVVAWSEKPASEVSEVFVATPRYLRQPEHGPPVS